MTSRRSWMQQFLAIGSGAILISPKELLGTLQTSEFDWDHHIDGHVRLSSNENPYAPSEAMKVAINELGDTICRYPNQFFGSIEKMIADIEGVPADNVVLTSGSREGLKAVGLIKAIAGGEIACCLPTYRALLTYAEQWGAKLRVSPLKADFNYNLEAIEESINDDTQMVFICNPNNPTGTLLDAGELESFTRRVAQRTTVFIDEVYYDYVEEPNYPSMKHLILEGENVIIARTLSKIYGLAGVRVGYIMAGTETATHIRDTLMSGTNIFGTTLAATALKDAEFKKFSLAKNAECKNLIYNALDKIGLKYLRSHANFVFFHTGRPIAEVQESFKSQGVMVGRAFPPYMDWCRISTGKVEEVQQFVNALHKVFA